MQLEEFYNLGIGDKVRVTGLDVGSDFYTNEILPFVGQVGMVVEITTGKIPNAHIVFEDDSWHFLPQDLELVENTRTQANQWVEDLTAELFFNAKDVPASLFDLLNFLSLLATEEEND